MPPYNPIFGHLLLSKSLSSQIPTDVHKHYIPRALAQENQDTPFEDQTDFSIPHLAF